MLRKLLFSLCIVLTSWSLALAQVGRLQGVISDKDTGEPIPFANIILENGGTQVGGASSDFDGNYDINPIPPGTYDLKATFVGYNTFIMKGVVISPNKITFQIPEAFRKNRPQGDINPLTGEEYLTNTVRRHPEMEEFVQVYDQATHSWSDVREDYFWEFQDKKKQMLGKDYRAPILI